MTDQELIRALQRLDVAASVDPRFHDFLLDRLVRERRRRRPVRLVMLAAAALLGGTLIGGSLLAGALDGRRTARVSEPPTSATPATPSTPAASAASSVQPSPQAIVLDLSNAIPEADITGAPDVRIDRMAATADAIWLHAYDNFGRQSRLIRVDASTGDIRRIPVDCGDGCAGPFPGNGSSVWAIGRTLVRVDATGAGEPEQIALPSSLSSHASVIAADEDDRVWIGRQDGVTLMSRDGTVLRSIDAPFAPRLDLGYHESMVPLPPTFGTLWAYDSAEAVVYRLDPLDGTVTGRIPLPSCPAIEHHANYPGHAPLVHPLTGVDGLDGAMVASCPMDRHHEYPGPLNVIDPVANRVRMELDVPPRYGPGIVVAGQWWVPLDGPPNDPTVGRLVHIDVATAARSGAVGVPLAPGRTGANALVAGDALWLLLLHVDPATGRQERSVLRLAAEDLRASGG